MNRKDFISRVCDALYDNSIRKPVSLKKTTFRITDDNGQDAEFTVKRQDKRVSYTISDVTNVLDACLAVIEDAIQHGEDVSLRNFGTFTLRRFGEKKVVDSIHNEAYFVPPKYVPKFIPGKQLKMASTLYQLSLEDREPEVVTDACN